MAIYQHHITSLEVTIEEALLVASLRQIFCQQAEVGLQLQLVEIKLSGFQETVFEIVEVEEYGVGVKFRLWIAVGEVKLTGSTQLHIRQFTDGTLQQFLLFQRITATSLTSTTDGIKQRYSAQVGLQVAQLIVTHCQNLRHWQLALGKMARQIDKGMVLVTTRAHTTYHVLTLRRRQSIVLTVTSTSRQLLYILGFLPTPFLVKFN